MHKDGKIGNAELLISRMTIGREPISLSGSAVKISENILRVVCFIGDEETRRFLEDNVRTETVRGICVMRGFEENVTHFCLFKKCETISAAEQYVVELTMELEPIKR